MKVIAILEARVSPENWDTLEQAYKAGTEQPPPQLVQSLLVHSTKDAIAQIGQRAKEKRNHGNQ